MARLSKEKEKEAMRRKQKRKQRRNAEKQVQETLVTVEDEGERVPNPGTTKDLRLPILRLSGSILYSMKWNIRQILIKPRPQLPVAYHQCADFDVLDAILSQPKRQPDSNLQENFEEGNEPKLERIMGNIVIIKDKHSILCVIKARNQKVSWLLPQIEPAVHEYVAFNNIAADHTRHGAMGARKCYKSKEMVDVQDNVAAKDDTKDATTLSSPEGNANSKFNLDSTLRTKGCVIGHHTFVPRMAQRTKDIQLGPGPAPSYTSKTAITALKVFAQRLLPLTQTVEALFHAFLMEEYSKYKAVYDTIYDGRADNIDKAFGIWTSRSLVINANTNNHKDLEDVCHE
ncbi:hypothetical protein L873DRAFT_1849652 [Choiromyces venosus 120613-1]|uniref:Uncharacterized protein n=1 Tax=Choiromyces venosus 120613-1 TaxID=1336337 RepID=A0A3N4IWE7_9PEZI|nr:hypothetical protein L873DRAFT_1849652 [Choiromyces venosus 120613-1]